MVRCQSDDFRRFGTVEKGELTVGAGLAENLAMLDRYKSKPALA